MSQNKILLSLVFLITITSVPGLFAQSTGILAEMAGDVSLRRKGGAWEQARIGNEILPGTVISTGFDSRAVVDLGTSVLTVKALTRLTLQELLQRGDTTTTKVFLDVGRIRARVETAEGVEHDFHFLSTVAVASVRGTEFEFDGERITAIEGTVAFSNAAGQTRTVSEGESSETTAYESPKSAEEQILTDTAVITNTSTVTPPAASLTSSGAAASDSGPETTTVRLTGE